MGQVTSTANNSASTAAAFRNQLLATNVDDNDLSNQSAGPSCHVANNNSSNQLWETMTIEMKSILIETKTNATKNL